MLNLLKSLQGSGDDVHKRAQRVLSALDGRTGRRERETVDAESLGMRNASLVSALDEIGETFVRLRTAESVLARARDALDQEFAARRAQQAEGAGLAALLEQTTHALGEAESRARDAEIRAAQADLLKDRLADADARRSTAEGVAESTALEIERLRAGLATTERDLAAARNVAAATDVERVRAEAAAEGARERAVEAEAELARTARDLSDHIERLADVQSERDSFLARVSELEATVARAQRRTAELELKLDGERGRADAAEIAQAASLERAEDLLQQLDAAMVEAATRVAAAEAERDAAKARADRMGAKRSDAAGSAIDAEGRIRALESAVAEADRRQERLAARAAEVEAERVALQAEFAAAESARIAAVERAERLGRMGQNRETELRQAEARHLSAETRVQELESAAAAERATNRERLRALMSEVERLKNESASASGALRALNSPLPPPGPASAPLFDRADEPTIKRVV